MSKAKNAIAVDVNDEILTPKEAADFCKVSRWALYKRVKSGQVISHKIGNRLYFLKSELISNIKEF